MRGLPFTCPAARLGRLISKLQRAYTASEEVAYQLRDPHLKTRVDQITMQIDGEQSAAIDMLSYERATSMLGASYQLLMVARYAGLIEAQTDSRDIIRDCEALNRNLYSAMGVLAEPCGADRYMIDHHMPDYLDEVGRIGQMLAA